MTDRFDLLQQIGKGGMGTVWRARDRSSGRTVAIKLIHPGLAEDGYHLARLEREVEVARRIDSPHVVRVLGYGQQGGLPYIAMEFVDGQSLRDLIAAGKTKDFSEWSHARSVLVQLATALAAAHKVGVIHRDIKPANVMIDRLGNVKLADFGIARAIDMSRMTGGETILGTPSYMAPDADTTAQSDLYALGCVVYEMVTGAPPFVGETAQTVLLKHLREEPDLSQVPEDLREMVGWLLQKDPDRRPRSAQALLDRLQPEPAPVPAVGTVSAQQPARPSRRWIRMGLALSVVACTAGAAGSLLWLSLDGPEPVPKLGGVDLRTPAPTLPPAPAAGPPVITGFTFLPVVPLNSIAHVELTFEDPDGDASYVHVRRLSGTYWEFGAEIDLPVSASRMQQWIGEAAQEFLYSCGDGASSAELEYTVVDRGGGKSAPAVALWECKP